jgi:acyl-coenzyme A thioesterase PaaI-like protein
MLTAWPGATDAIRSFETARGHNAARRRGGRVAACSADTAEMGPVDMNQMNRSAVLLGKFKKYPFGLWLFSRAICIKAPYFSTIRPTFTTLEPGRGEAKFKKRRAVINHLGTVHAIAMANLCELVAGTTLEITLPNTHRWIPKSMKINYLAKATTDVRARTAIDLATWPEAGSVNVRVEVMNTENATADIEMYISRRK